MHGAIPFPIRNPALLPNPWLQRERPRSTARVRLFCFAHAGGGPAAFRPWRGRLGPEIDLCSIVLPGRDGRRREPPCNRMQQVISPLVDAMRSAMDLPFALFGHSMGAAIAYEVARHLASSSLGEPLRLFVSGRRAAQLPARRSPFHVLPDHDFLRMLGSLNGTPPEVLADPELLQVFLPCLRADFELIETYQPEPGPHLSCPVSAYCGDSDPEVNARELVAWSRVTSGEFRSRMFKGDHFYLQGANEELLERIREDLLHGVDTLHSQRQLSDSATASKPFAVK
jgi:medium-chain acyl-[acyl-carrier-protein] hydrolase